MALSKINFNISTNGLGKLPTSEDYISGILFYTATIPALFNGGVTGSATVFSLAEAEALGLVKTDVNTDVFHYHISEYFRMIPNGKLYIYMAVSTANSYNFAELTTLQRFASGSIRQFAVYANTTTLSTSHATAIQAQLNIMSSEDSPAVCLYTADYTGVLSALPDMRSVNAYGVMPIAGESASGVGATLASAKSYAISMIGTVLGVLSKSGVSQSVGEALSFPIESSSEFNEIGYINGISTPQLKTLLDEMDTKGYVFARKFVGSSSTFINFGNNAVAVTNDLNTIELVRTIQKVQRSLYLIYLPFINIQVKLNPNGTPSTPTIQNWQGVGENLLISMAAAGEISAGSILMPPAQNIASTNQVVLTVKITPVGIAKTITFNLGYSVTV